MGTNEPTASEPAAHASLHTAPERVTDEATALRAEACIRSHAVASMAIGLVPSAALDVAGVVAIEIRMIRRLAKIYGFPYPATLVVLKVLAAVLGSIPTALVAMKLRGSLVGMSFYAVKIGLLSVTGGASVYAVGKVFQRHFESGGTFLSRDSSLLRGFVRNKYDEGKQALAACASPAPQPAGLPSVG